MSKEKIAIQIERISNKISDLESKIFQEKLKENQRMNNMGWGHGNRNSKISLSTSKSDKMNLKLEDLNSKLEDLKNKLKEL